MCPPSHDSDCLSENFGSLPIARVAQPERPQKRGGVPLTKVGETARISQDAEELSVAQPLLFW